MSRDTLIDQRPFYMSRLEVDPSNRDRVFFASENLIETRDGGKTFIDVSSAVHQDHHGFWISHDGRRIIEADDGGAPISLDGGATWDWRFNVTLAQVYHIGYDRQNPYHVCAAMQDDDSFCAPNLSLSPLGLQNADWRDVANDADGVWVWPDPSDSNLVWNVGINELNGQLGIFNLRSRQNQDVTPDVTDTNGIALAGLTYRFNWEAPIAFSSKEPGVAYFGANVVFQSSDRGLTWKAISPDLTRNDPTKQQLAGGPINTDISGAEFYDTILDIAPSPLDSNVLWVGTDDGVISRTADHGAHWANVTPAWIEPWGRVECVEASHVSADRAYAVIDRHLLGDRHPYVVVTDDGGVTWRPIVSGLPGTDMARVVREDARNPNVLFAGTERGVWFSVDRGASWDSLQLDMPSVSVHDLRIQPQQNDLIAGTHGRGVYVLDDVAPIEELAAARTADAPYLFPIRPAYSWYYWWRTAYGTYDTECCAPAGVFSAADPPMGALVTLNVPPAARGSASIDVTDSTGASVRSWTVPLQAGIDRFSWNLTAAPPIAWKRARAWNAGPDDGPPVVPGQYTIRLHVGARDVRAPVTVFPDPRASWTQQDYVARYAFLKGLDDELSAIDDALNRMDAALPGVTGAKRRAIATVYREMTSGVVNSEDDQWMPDRLRERLTILQGVVALSQAPPLPPHEREAAAIHAEFVRVMADYQQVIEEFHIH